MANLPFYEEHFNIHSVDELLNLLCETAIETNHTYEFFVNWNKVIENRDAIKYELALLGSLRNSTDPVQALRDLLTKYPEVVKVIPILLAVRDGIIKTLDSLEPDINYKIFNFEKGQHSSADINQIVEFTQKTSLLNQLTEMESATDYMLGIEVGLDSNARKNRSGQFLESVISEILQKLVKEHPDIKCVEQKKFQYIKDIYNIATPDSLRDKKFDTVLLHQSKNINIEVNFYSGTGSKPSEIVNSYINRAQVLKAANWDFVWLTDGDGWKHMQNPFRIGIENIPYVINTWMLKKGILEKIIF